MDQDQSTKSTTFRTATIALSLAGFAALAVGGIIFFVNSVDPNQPCTLNCPVNTPVCGQDGFWYANSCIASCSNVRIARSEKICVGAPRIVSPSSEESERILDFSHLLKRHADKGFHYIGHLSQSEDAVPSPPAGFTWESANASNQQQEAAAAASYETSPMLEYDIPGAWIVLEEDGSVYVKNEENSSAESTDQILSVEYWGESGQTYGSPSGCGQGMASTPSTPPNPTGSEFVASDPPPYVTAGPRKLLVQDGFDSRKQVSNGNVSYYKQVGELWPIGCSGALIGPSHVLTAGHCLWGRPSNKSFGEDGSWRRSDEFYAGRTSDSSFAGHSRIVRKIIHRQYRQLHEDEFEWDYGLATLEKPLGAELGWLGMKFDCAPGFTTSFQDGLMTLTVAGYPADKPLHTMWEDRCSNIASGCHMRSVVHKCDTAPGMSGSAMIQHLPNQPPMIRAVHVAGGPSGNRATLIQRSMFHAVTAWRATADTCPRTLNNNGNDSSSQRQDVYPGN